MQRNSTSFDLPVPAHMCMPITELQRKAEELEYSELLDQVPSYLATLLAHHSVLVWPKTAQACRMQAA